MDLSSASGPPSLGILDAGPETLVSVVINNHNYGQYLGLAVDSALRQTHPRIEVIVVDDGSTDGSRAVVASYGDRVRAVLKDNGGQISAVQAGLELARGDAVLVLDSDDVLLADTAEKCVAAFSRDERCVRVQFRLRVVAHDGTPTGVLEPPAHWPLKTGDLVPYVSRHRTFRSPPLSGNAWSRRALLALSPAPTEVFDRMHVDRWWSELTALLGTVAALPEPGGEYRVHGGNDSLRRSRSAGAAFLQSRVAMTLAIHAAGTELSSRHGVGGFPADVDLPLDSTFFAWRIGLRKLRAEDPAPSSSLLSMALRCAAALVSQPELPYRKRLGRLAWLGLVVLTPRGSRPAARLVHRRYARG